MPQYLSRCLLALILATLGACSAPDIRLYDPAQQPASQVATVTMPEQLELLSINGAEVKGGSGMWIRGDRRFELAPGRYGLLVFYREIWQLGDGHDVLRSNPALFELDAAAGGHYRIDYVHPAGYAEAQRLAAHFEGSLRDEAGGSVVASRPSGLKFRDGLSSQLSGGAELMMETPTSAAGSQVVAPLAADVDVTAVKMAPAPPVQPIAPLPPAALPPPTARVAPAAPAVPAAPAAQRDWLSLMKNWWVQATAEERRAFLAWTAEHP